MKPTALRRLSLSTISACALFAGALSSPIFSARAQSPSEWTPEAMISAAQTTAQVAVAPSEILNTLTATQVSLKFMLAASGEPDAKKIELFDRAVQWLRDYYAAPAQDVEINSVDELDQFREKIRFETYTLEEEIAERSATPPPTRWNLKTSSPDVIAELNKIRDTARARVEEITQAVNGKASSGMFSWLNFFKHNSEVDTQTLTSLLPLLAVNATPETAAQILAHPETSAKTKLSVVNGLERGFEAASREIRGLGERLASSPDFKLANRPLQVFLTTIIGEYYKRVPRAMIKNILSDLIEFPEKATPLERFESMVLNSGVQFQKLFQIYARQEGIPEEIKAIFKRLEKNTKRVPWRLVKREIDKHQVPFKWVKIEEKPLAKATINQVHVALIQHPENDEVKEGVIRLIKPGSIESIRSDNQVLPEVAKVLDTNPELIAANFPKLAPFVTDLQSMALVDTDLVKTTRNHVNAARLYNRTITLENGRQVEIHVPWIIPLPKGATMMVMEKLPGIGFDDFIEQNPESARLGAEAFMRTWLEVAFDPKKSLLHADAHLGNVMAAEQDGVIRMFILDYGMVSTLTMNMQSKVMALGIVARTHDPDFIARSLWDLSVKSQSQISEQEFRRLVGEKIKTLDAKGVHAWPMPEWLVFASNAGLRLPYSLSYFNRGFVTMTRLVDTVGSDLRTPEEMKKILLKHPLQLFRMLFSSREFSLFDWFRILRAALSNKSGAATLTPGYVNNEAAPNGNVSSATLPDAQRSVRCELLFSGTSK
ncbi:MAG: AarF/UbiB family protein [Bdellovibrionaceae bacterium]|nr:AarF/UbiB family protein [Pseudobdellovibrionaceae bacterium]